MPVSSLELRDVISNQLELAEPAPSLSHASQRLSYRQESSLSPQRSWSRSLSRVRLFRPAAPADSPAESPERWPIALPWLLRRFVGYRTRSEKGTALFRWQDKMPRQLENSLLSCFGSFASIIAIEAINVKSGLFDDWHRAPLIIASLGASAVLLFSAVESPLAQPRNAIGGQMLSALVAISVNRLFALNSAYSVVDPAPLNEFSRLNWLSAALSMAIALGVMELTGTVHPPGGATALICSVQPSAVALEWKFLLVIFASITTMVGIAFLFDNLGHRRYPTFWWSPGDNEPMPEDDKQGPRTSSVGMSISPDSNASEAERRGRSPHPRNMR